MKKFELYHYGILGMKWGIRKNSDLPSRNDRRAKDEMQSRADILNRDFKASGKRVTVEQNPYWKEGIDPSGNKVDDRYIYVVRSSGGGSPIYYTEDEAQEMIDELTKLPGKLGNLIPGVTVEQVDKKYKEYQLKKKQHELEQIKIKVKRTLQKIGYKIAKAVGEAFEAGKEALGIIFSGFKRK